MADLVVIVPSRGRPEAAAELAQAFVETCTADTLLMIAVDESDPSASDYGNISRPRYPSGEHVIQAWSVPGSTSMVQAVNATALRIVAPLAHFTTCSLVAGPDLTCTCGYWAFASAPMPFAIGFLGDDHRPRTKGWDSAYVAALREFGTGIVYGNDLLQGENLPTQCAMTADIVRALGYMAPTGLRHMYVDDFWLTLGREADCIRYLPEVLVEHMHPLAHKAEWDSGYRRVNAQHVYDQDRNEFNRYCRHELPGAVDKVRALRAGVPA